ncbi:MAG: two-component sensor histidine kinase [Spirochaetia bacterium]|nr:two-component sensor histidine kinase [Spirochaetia bacterium]
MNILLVKHKTIDQLTKSIGILLHPIAFLLLIIDFERFHLPERWRIQVSLLVLFSFLLTGLLLRVRKFYQAQIIFALRFLALLVLGFPLGENLLIEGVLLAALLSDMCLWFRPVVGALISILLLAISIVFQQNVLVWNIYQTHAPWRILLGFALLFVILILGLYLFNWYRLKSRTNRVLIDSYEDTVGSLMEANLKLQDNIMNEIGTTLTVERKRIARELHDIIGHSMVNIMMLSESMQDKLYEHPEQIIEMMVMVKSEAQRTLHDSEKTLRNLKDQDSDRKYDIAAVKRLVNVFQKATRVRVELELRNAPNSFGNNINRIVYRSIQECMTNSFRHGKASLIKIMFWRGPEEMEIVIRDNGTGAKELEEGIGLWGIRERLAAIDGKLEVQNSRSGFIVVVRFPWN